MSVEVDLTTDCTKFTQNGTSQEPSDIEHVVSTNGLKESDYKLLAKQLAFEHCWLFWYDDKAKKGMAMEDYENAVKPLGEFSTIEEFWRYMNTLQHVSKFPDYANLRLFKKGIRPMWEDPANENGGRWVISCSKRQTESLWSQLVLMLVGEQFRFSDNMCGAVLSIRPGTDNINIWNASGDNQEEIDVTIEEIKSFLGVTAVKYQLHREAQKKALSRSKSRTLLRSASIQDSDLRSPNSPDLFLDAKSPENKLGHNRSNSETMVGEGRWADEEPDEMDSTPKRNWRTSWDFDATPSSTERPKHTRTPSNGGSNSKHKRSASNESNTPTHRRTTSLEVTHDTTPIKLRNSSPDQLEPPRTHRRTPSSEKNMPNTNSNNNNNTARNKGNHRRSFSVTEQPVGPQPMTNAPRHKKTGSLTDESDAQSKARPGQAPTQKRGSSSDNWRREGGLPPTYPRKDAGKPRDDKHATTNRSTRPHVQEINYYAYEDGMEVSSGSVAMQTPPAGARAAIKARDHFIYEYLNIFIVLFVTFSFIYCYQTYVR